jgi:hypothetical protein
MNKINMIFCEGKEGGFFSALNAWLAPISVILSMSKDQTRPVIAKDEKASEQHLFNVFQFAVFAIRVWSFDKLRMTEFLNKEMTLL